MENKKILKETFNPENSILRQQQYIMLDILKVVDELCEKYEIKYWLSSGTLLGAVRHQGFIPWDDDLDIEMFHEDYEQFINILLKENTLPKDYVLQTTKTDPNYIYPFAKIRYKRSRIIEPNKRQMAKGFDGIFIDIFPIYKTYKKISIFSFNIGRIYYKILENNSKNILYKTLQHITYYLFRLAIFPLMHYVSLFLHKGEEYGHSLGMPFKYYSRNRKDILPLNKILFEETLFPCPNDIDKYLSKLYGNSYMKLPNIEDITTHTTSIDIYK